jgi:p-aminobenzoyl-glutamate transporter AbgT
VRLQVEKIIQKRDLMTEMVTKNPAYLATEWVVVAGVDAEAIADIAHVTSTDLVVTPTARKVLERRTRVRQTR